MRSPLLLMLFLVAACERAAEKKDDTPTLPTAVGSVELTLGSPELADTFLATEAEIFRSEAFVSMANATKVHYWSPNEPLASDAIRAARRAGSAIIDVSVRDADGDRARRLCDDVLQNYVEFSALRAVERISRRQAMVGEVLGEARGRTLLAELDEHKRRALGQNVRLLGRCKPQAATSAAADAPPGTASKGSIAFDPKTPDAATSMLSTEVQVLRSEAIVRMANERMVGEPQGAELTRDAIRVSRRARSMIIDVSVADPDPRRAAMFCNVLIESYLEHRMLGAVAAAKERQRIVLAKLAGKPDDEVLRREAEELELDVRAPERDVVALDRCRASAP